MQRLADDQIDKRIILVFHFAPTLLRMRCNIGVGRSPIATNVMPLDVSRIAIAPAPKVQARAFEEASGAPSFLALLNAKIVTTFMPSP